MKKKPKVFLSWTLNSGTAFYRLFNFIKYMRKEIDFAFSKWKPNFQEVADWEYKLGDPMVQRDLAFLMDNSEMIIAQKYHSVGGLTVLNVYRDKYPKKPFYTDLDDNLFAITPDSPAFDNYHVGSELENVALEQIMNSTGLIVSTEYLRKIYEEKIAMYSKRMRLNLVPNIWVIPNAIDFDVWDKLKEKRKRSKKLTIGWAGGGTHVKDLELIENVIKRITKKHTNVQFVFLGGTIPSLEKMRNVKALRKWCPINEYPQALKDLNIDIGIAPLRDNAFNRGKSNLRWLEYSAMKIPTVASNVEPYKCIKQWETGLLCDDEDDWVFNLENLICNKKLRNDIGKNAYDQVRKDFNAEGVAKLYADNIKDMLKGKKSVSGNALVEALQDGRIQT